MAPILPLSILWPLFRRLYIQHVLPRKALSATGRRRFQRKAKSIHSYDLIRYWNDMPPNALFAKSQLPRIGIDLHDDIRLGKKE